MLLVEMTSRLVVYEEGESLMEEFMPAQSEFRDAHVSVHHVWLGVPWRPPCSLGFLRIRKSKSTKPTVIPRLSSTLYDCSIILIIVFSARQAQNARIYPNNCIRMTHIRRRPDSASTCSPSYFLQAGRRTLLLWSGPLPTRCHFVWMFVILYGRRLGRSSEYQHY